MIHPQFTILFVDSPAESADFYSRLFELQPVENSPTFALFILPDGLQVGLWSRHTARPIVQAEAGGSELCFRLDTPAEVDRLYAEWSKLRLRVLQAPVEMDFGYTFVMADPDGHRLRGYARSA